MSRTMRAFTWLLLLPVMASAHAAAAVPTAWLGHWTDASAGTSAALGDLTVAADHMSLSGVESWQTSSQGQFDSGQLFQVTHTDKTPDPLGCGPGSTVSFIAIIPIAADPGIAGPGIKLLFFADKTPPDPAAVGQDRRLCETHPFTR